MNLTRSLCLLHATSAVVSEELKKKESKITFGLGLENQKIVIEKNQQQAGTILESKCDTS